MTTSEVVTAALTLKPVEAEHFDEAYVGTPQPCPWPKAYGGDLVGPATAALVRSVGPDRAIHSMHSYFLRPVEIGAEVRYEVEHLRDGRGYSTRHLRAYQAGKVVYAAMASFHTGEAGDAFATPFPDGVPDPSSLPSSADYLRDEPPGTGTMTAASKAYWSNGRGFDMRHVPGPVYLRVEGERTPHQAVWVKPFDPLRPVDGLSREQLHTAALAYVCDYTILEPILRVLGRPWAEPGLVTASLDHAMWFHRAGSVDDWLLYVQDAVAADSGRGLGAGRFFTRDRRHLATVAQEGMIRAS
ncbi:acyl-CoA thioesterase [Paractinoplanes globisporus]|uniref:Acyl-CoA thioesterase n=1 Tax=Paractinoplanes globisporus TaxID=113565 RepID=A0ABW6WBH8_9ACTN|nr:acyl-CoA thioesterase domain-containing protein [Actinoplanes globisporus]